MSEEKYAQLISLCSLCLPKPEHIPSEAYYHLIFSHNLQDHHEKITAISHYLQPKLLNSCEKKLKEKLMTTVAKIMNALPIRLDWVYQQQCVNAIDPSLYSHPHISPIIEQWKKSGYQRIYNETLEPDSVPDFFAALVRRGIGFEDGIKMARQCMQLVAPSIRDKKTEWLVKESALKLYHALAEKGYNRQEALDAIKFIPDAPIAKKIKTICGPG